jgi:predicted transcriptional regulator
MTRLLEIKTAISHLSERERAFLSAELFLLEEPAASVLEAALDRGLDDIQAGRVRPFEEVRETISSWISKS